MPEMSSLLVGKGGAALAALSAMVERARALYCAVYAQGRRGPGEDVGVRDRCSDGGWL